ncbi:MAG: hypothetical protein AAFV53_03000 [Myxococcota bacterium]
MWRAPTEEQLSRGVPVWVLEIDWSGQIFRFADRPITLQGEDGTEIHFAGELAETDLEESVNTFRTSVSSLSVPMELTFPVDVQHRIMGGRPLSAARGELSMVLADPWTGAPLQRYEQRFRVLRGRIEQPERAHPDEDPGWVNCSLEARPLEDRSLIIPSSARMTQRNFPNSDDEARGKPMPIAFGVGAGFDGVIFRATPAYRIGDRVYLISLGRVAATEVTIWDEDNSTVEVPVEHDTDRYGNLYAFVTIPLATISFGQELWVSWYTSSAGVQGGVLRIDGDGPVSGAGDLLLWLFARSRLEVNIQAWVSVRQLLNRYKFAGWIGDADTSPWEWAKKEILPLLPVAVVNRFDGVEPIVFDVGETGTRIRAEVTEGPEFYPLSALRALRSSDQIVNAVSIDYMHDAFHGGHRETSRTGSSFVPQTLIDDGQVPTQYAIESQRRWGEVRERTLSSDYLYDDATAALIADEYIQRWGDQVDGATFSAAPRYGWLQIGDRIRFTSERLGFVEVPAVITGRTWLSGEWRFGIQFERDVVRDPKP